MFVRPVASSSRPLSGGGDSSERHQQYACEQRVVGDRPDVGRILERRLTEEGCGGGGGGGGGDGDGNNGDGCYRCTKHDNETDYAFYARRVFSCTHGTATNVVTLTTSYEPQFTPSDRPLVICVVGMVHSRCGDRHTSEGKTD